MRLKNEHKTKVKNVVILLLAVVYLLLLFGLIDDLWLWFINDS